MATQTRNMEGTQIITNNHINLIYGINLTRFQTPSVSRKSEGILNLQLR